MTKIATITGMLAWSLAAQTYSEPPPLMRLVRWPGFDLGSGRPYADARVAINVLGMVCLTGPAESWHVEIHDSFGGIEDVMEALRAATADRLPEDAPYQLPSDVLGASRSLIAAYRPWLSYRPEQAIRMLSKARYFHVSLYRTRPGADADLVELLKLRKSSLDSINLDRPDIAYQVISGAPAGTFLVLSPMTSLRTLDEGLTRRPLYIEPGPIGARVAANKIAGEGDINRTHLLFRVEPGMSHVSAEFASEAPDFWKPKQTGQ